MTITTATCANCGVPDLGTRFCESCGHAMVRPAAVPEIAAGVPAAGRFSTRAPLLMFISAAAAITVLSSISTGLYMFGNDQNAAALNFSFQVIFVLLDAVSVTAIVLVGRRSGASMAARVGAIALAVVEPVFDLAFLVSMVQGVYDPLSGVGQLVLLLTPILLTLAWLLASHAPGPSYRVVWIAVGATLLALFGARLLFGVYYIATEVLLTGGLVLAVLLAPKVATRRARDRYAPAYATAGGTAPGGLDAAYAAIPRPSTTNGFAVSALIFGLIGGTVLPIVFGHVAHSQIRRTGERGWGMATAGLILGYISTIAVIVIIIVVAVLAAQTPRYY